MCMTKAVILGKFIAYKTTYIQVATYLHGDFADKQIITSITNDIMIHMTSVVYSRMVCLPVAMITYFWLHLGCLFMYKLVTIFMFQFNQVYNCTHM